MNICKKMLKHGFILSLIFTIFISSKPAHSAAGLVSGSPFVVTAGLVIGAAGIGSAAITIAKAESASDELDSVFTYLIGGLITAAIFTAGFIVLDGDQALQYRTLSVQEASKLGINESARQMYNSEIDQVNALAGFVDAEMSQLKKATVSDSAALWSLVKGAVSVQTFEVMQAVTLQLYK